jgi:shikimate dehydrogenase
MRFCIIGHPVSHSLSPRIYTRFFEMRRIDATYEALDIQIEEFPSVIDGLLQKYDGLNVTIPFKETIVAHVDCMVERSLRAVNCIFKRAGYNTDWLGFSHSFRDIEIEEPITILGAGGASRAVIYALKRSGVRRINIINRSLARAEKTAEDFNDENFEVKIFSFDSLLPIVKESKSIINATSIGMKGECLGLGREEFQGVSLVYDLIYSETPLQKIARECGVENVIGGKTMLFFQACENLKIWGLFDEKVFERAFEEVAG